MTSAELLILLKAKDESSNVLKAVERQADSLGNKVSSLGGRMGGALRTGGILAAGGIGAAGFALLNFTKAAAEEEASIAQLEQAVRNTGYAFEDAGSVLDDNIKAAEKLAFADDEARTALTQLTNATGNYKEAASRLTIAQDLARGTGMDLATASKLVGKVSEENTQVLKRYGITLRDGATEQEALAEIQKRFGGQAERYAETATAKWQIFNNQMDNMKETIGAALLPVVTALGAQLGEFLTAHQDDIERFSQALAEKIPGAIEAIAQAIQTARPYITFIFENIRAGFEVIRPGLEWIIDKKPVLVAALAAVGVAALLAFSPVTVPILAVVAAIGGLLFAIGLVRRHWDEIKAKTQEVWDSIADVVNDRLSFLVTIVTFYFETYKNVIATAVRVVRDIITIVLALIRGDWSAAWEGIKQLVSDIWNGIVTDIGLKLGLIRDALTFAWALIRAIAETAWNGLRDLAGRVWGEIKDAVIGPVQAIIDKIQDLIEKIQSIPSPGDILGGFGDALGSVNPFGATGGLVTRGGLVMVGERGPEMVALPGGSRIYNNDETREAITFAGRQQPVVINVYIDRNEMHGDIEAGVRALGLGAV